MVQSAKYIRRCRLRDFLKHFVREIFAKFTGKHLCRSIFFKEVAGCRSATLLKRDSGIGVFPWILLNLSDRCFYRTLQATVLIVDTWSFERCTERCNAGLNIFNVFTLDPSRHDPGRRERKNLNFYFHTSSWCFYRFYKSLKSLHKTFWGTTKKFLFKFLF